MRECNSRSRAAASVLGICGSLLLHLLLITPVFWGATSQQRRPQDEGGSSNERALTRDDALVVFFVDDSDTHTTGGAAPLVASSLPSPRNLLMPIPTLDIPIPRVVALSDKEMEEQDTSAVEVGGAPDAARALMFGRYIGQITARVERAWLRPRTPLASGRFECRARIVQEENGAVREIELEQCSGDPTWQLSLARAIQTASPLPAPPDPGVFSRTLRVQFTSESFSPTADPAAFEPDSHTAMR